MRWLSERPSRWPLQAFFAAIALLVVIAGAGAGLEVKSYTASRERASALSEATFAAQKASKQISGGISYWQNAVHPLVSDPSVAQIYSNPSVCKLGYGPIGAFDTGHIDLIRLDGSVVCSSQSVVTAFSYSGQSWLQTAGAAVYGPIHDGATGQEAALVIDAIPGLGFITVFLDLRPLGAKLASEFGSGAYRLEFLVVSKDGRSILGRSVDPARWTGATLAGSRFLGAAEGRDVDGRARFYGRAGVGGAGWTVYVGADAQNALSGADPIQNQSLVVLAAGVIAVLFALIVVYRGVASPITALSAAVRSSASQASPRAVEVAGPAQVRMLAQDINAFIEAVNREWAERSRAEANYRLLFNDSPLPMWVYDSESQAILEVNDHALRRYGYTREEFLQLSLQDLIPAEQFPSIAQLTVRSEGTSRLGPVYQLKKDGKAFEARITAHPVLFHDRRAQFVMIEEVTEQEKLEQQLRQSQRLESLGQLAGGVAHDFNNLLGVIVNFASFAKEEVAKAAQKKGGEHWRQVEQDLEQVERAAERGGQLTHQLLMFARREVAQVQIIDVNEVVRQLEPLLKRTLGEHVQLSIHPEDGIWPILMDQGQLEQVLVNLAVNARDAMPDGGSLSIDTQNVEVEEAYAASRPGIPTGRYVRLRVSDTGIGMDEATVQRAFEPFFTTKPKGEGTGLGLATVYGLITQAGGRATIYSEPGHGTTFTAMLPATEATADHVAESKQERSGGRETVLVVEDEDALREVTVRMLKRNGYNVLSAGDGGEALELLGDHGETLDLLITDVVMPRMLGREVAARVQALRPESRVLYISGYAQPVLGSQGTLAPGVVLLEKPFTEPVLLAKVREVLDA